MHLPIQERLTLGNADLRGAVLGCPSIQDAPPLRPGLGSPSIQSTHCPEAGQHQCNEENLGSNCPKQRTQSKKCSKKDCWLRSTTSVQNHFQTAVSGCWQEPDDIHTLGQGGIPKDMGSGAAKSMPMVPTCHRSVAALLATVTFPPAKGHSRTLHDLTLKHLAQAGP